MFKKKKINYTEEIKIEPINGMVTATATTVSNISSQNNNIVKDNFAIKKT